MKKVRDAAIKGDRSPEGGVFQRLVDDGEFMHNLTRATVGLVLILTIWFLPFTRNPLLAAFLFMSAGLLVAASSIGTGYNSRFDHMIFPYLLMLAAVSAHACTILLGRLVKRVEPVAKIRPVG
jgi:ABC-type spermidine/putrescine transport system permease subunit I